MVRSVLSTLFVACVVASGVSAQDDLSSSASKVRMSLAVDRSNVEPGGKVRLAVILDHEPYWHTYAHNSPAAVAQSLITVDIKVTPDPAQLAVYSDKIGWPEPHQVEFSYGGPPTMLEVYEGRAIVYVPITVAMAAAMGPVEIPVTARVQTCDDKTCLQPADLTGSITINVVPHNQAQTSGDYEEIFRDFPEAAFASLNTPAPVDHPHEDDPTPIILIVAIGGAVLIVGYLWMKYAR